MQPLINPPLFLASVENNKPHYYNNNNIYTKGRFATFDVIISLFKGSHSRSDYLSCLSLNAIG